MGLRLALHLRPRYRDTGFRQHRLRRAEGQQSRGDLAGATGGDPEGAEARRAHDRDRSAPDGAGQARDPVAVGAPPAPTRRSPSASRTCWSRADASIAPCGDLDERRPCWCAPIRAASCARAISGPMAGAISCFPRPATAAACWPYDSKKNGSRGSCGDARATLAGQRSKPCPALSSVTPRWNCSSARPRNFRRSEWPEVSGIEPGDLAKAADIIAGAEFGCLLRLERCRPERHGHA